jgi:hypothetical protein
MHIINLACLISLVIAPLAAKANPRRDFKQTMLQVLMDQQNTIQKLESRIHEMVKSERQEAQKVFLRLDGLKQTLESDYPTVTHWNKSYGDVVAALSNQEGKELTQRDLQRIDESTRSFFTKSESSILQTKTEANSMFANGDILPAVIQRYKNSCWIFLGWSDFSRGYPERQVGRLTYGDPRLSDRIQMSGNVNENDSLFMWTGCGNI